MDGKKTYIAAAIGAFLIVATMFNWVPHTHMQAVKDLALLLLFGSAATLRHGIKKDSEKTVEAIAVENATLLDDFTDVVVAVEKPGDDLEPVFGRPDPRA